MTAASRIVGIDVARGLAVLGMFGAHIGVITTFDWSQPETWTDVVSGRSSILFATLAGVSIAIISGRRVAVVGPELSRVRLRIAARASLVFVIGVLLVALGTNVAVILPHYALLFLLALPFLRVPPRWLFVIALAVALLVPFLLDAMGPALGDPPNPGAALAGNLLATGSYPVLLWVAFVLTGLGIGRFDLTSQSIQVRLLVVGAALATIGYGVGEFAVATLGRSPIVTTAPHSGSPFEVVGSVGFAIAVLALCLLVSSALAGRAMRRLLFPLAAVGSMVLSVYSLQIVAIALIGASVPGEDDNRLWMIFVAVALAAASVWRVFLGRGPLERLLSAASHGAAGLVPADRLDPATPQIRNQKS